MTKPVDPKKRKRALSENRLDITHAAERREKFYAARRSGLGMWDAAASIGVTDSHTVKRYERWFQVTESGQEVVVRRPGGPSRVKGIEW